MLKIEIPFDALRLDLTKIQEFNSAYAALDLNDLEDTLLYSWLDQDRATFSFDGLPRRFESEESFIQEFVLKIADMAKPFSLPLQ